MQQCSVLQLSINIILPGTLSSQGKDEELYRRFLESVRDVTEQSLDVDDRIHVEFKIAGCVTHTFLCGIQNAPVISTCAYRVYV